MFCQLLLGKTISLHVCGIQKQMCTCADSKGKCQVTSSVSPLLFEVEWVTS